MKVDTVVHLLRGEGAQVGGGGASTLAHLQSPMFHTFDMGLNNILGLFFFMHFGFRITSTS